MISKSQLLYKLEKQSTLLEKSFNLPEYFGAEPIAQAIYNFSSSRELVELLMQSTSEDIYIVILEHKNLKYLLINEIYDGFLIEELHKEIEKMATRLESMIIINMTKIQLISNIYELFGRDDESKYIVDANNINLEWLPCFKTLKDQQAVISCNIDINDISFQLIATKVHLDECSQEQLQNSLTKSLVQTEDSTFNNQEEKPQINTHLNWLLGSVDCLSNIESDNSDKHPVYFNINNQNYLVYGFPLSPSLQISREDKCKSLHVHIKDTVQKQVFILDLEGGKLTLDCHFLNKTEKNDYDFSPRNKWLHDAVLTRDDACGFPLVFNNSYYLMIIRPYEYVDYLKNAL